MSVELIAFDKNRHLQYEGFCKLSVNPLASILMVEPQNKAYPVIYASFTWSYVARKNILFIFAEHAFMDLALVFEDETASYKVYYSIPQPLIYLQEVQQENSIRSRFLSPILNKINENPAGNPNLIQVIAQWILQFEGDLKQEYIKIFEKSNAVISTMNEIELDKQISMEEQSLLQRSVPESMFELRENSKGEENKKLIVFTSEKKDFCYCYFWKKGKVYRCYSCKDKKTYVTAKLCEKENHQKYLELNETGHVCRQRNYQNEIEGSEKLYSKKRQPPITFIAER